MKLSENNLSSSLRTDARSFKLSEGLRSILTYATLFYDLREKGSWYPTAGLRCTHISLQDLVWVLLALSIDC